LPTECPGTDVVDHVVNNEPIVTRRSIVYF
jgi:hypothetical protein